jgi:minimal PKS acyl carrier protein
MAEPRSNMSFSLDDLRNLMRAYAGIDESVDMNGNIGGHTFEELGYDSLAVLEMTAKIQNTLSVVITDNTAQELTTPQLLVDYVTTRLMDNQAAIYQAAIGL